jgi:hypothetical protein
MINLLKQKSHTLIIIAVLIAILIISYIAWQNSLLRPAGVGTQIEIESLTGGTDSAAGEA